MSLARSDPRPLALATSSELPELTDDEALLIEACGARMASSAWDILLLMELECIEPQLFLHTDRGAADRFATGIAAALDRASTDPATGDGCAAD